MEDVSHRRPRGAVRQDDEEMRLGCHDDPQYDFQGLRREQVTGSVILALQCNASVERRQQLGLALLQQWNMNSIISVAIDKS